MSYSLNATYLEEAQSAYTYDPNFTLGRHLSTAVLGEGDDGNGALIPGAQSYKNVLGKGSGPYSAEFNADIGISSLFFIPAGSFIEKDIFINDAWLPTYEHPLLHLATPPIDTYEAEKRAYKLGYFQNPVFPTTLDQYRRAYIFKEIPTGAMIPGAVLSVWDWRAERETTLFVRRRIGFDDRFAVFDVGFVDRGGMSGLCLCELNGADVTGGMWRALELGEARIPIEFWHAYVTCDTTRLTWIRSMTMDEVVQARRAVCTARAKSVL